MTEEESEYLQKIEAELVGERLANAGLAFKIGLLQTEIMDLRYQADRNFCSVDPNTNWDNGVDNKTRETCQSKFYNPDP